MSLTQIRIGSSTVDYASYASVAEADEYLAVDPVLRTMWADQDADGKGIGLVAATRHLDSLVWAGAKAEADQETQWPRSGLLDRDGGDLGDTVVPLEIEQVTILLAGDLAQDPAALTADGEAEVQREQVGPKAVSYFWRQRDPAERAIPNARALALVRCWLAGQAPGIPEVSGTDGVSLFADQEPYGRSRGLA